MKQKRRIILYLKEHGNLSSLNPWYTVGISTLSPVITQLRKEGFCIVTLREPALNPFKEKRTVAVYYLKRFDCRICGFKKSMTTRRKRIKGEMQRVCKKCRILIQKGEI